MNRVRIGDYFRPSNRSFSARDYREINRIRNKINSFEYESDIKRWLFERRQSSFNRYEDSRLFGISVDAIIENDGIRKVNKYYRQTYGDEGYSSNSNGISKLDYLKRDKDGNPILNADGSEKEYGAFGKRMINFANNTMNSSLGRSIIFIVRNIKVILIALICTLIITFSTIALVYIGGVVNSMGSTPFVLCGEDEITGAVITQLPSAEVAEMATPEYALMAFVSVAKQRGWKDEAIVGTLSYILQEGSGMGTFTYEGYYIWDGPSNVTFDKTLNNQMWLDWLMSEGREQAHNGYYRYNTTRYASVGIGILQSSDVWNYDGSMDSNEATSLINYAESNGKPWQDPETQMNYYFDHVFSRPTAFDTIGIDPTMDNLSSEEWARRVTAGIGMPAYSWTDNNSYMNDHLRHLSEAESILRNFTGASIGSLDEQTENPCRNANSIISGGNATIADAAVSLASGDGPSGRIYWDVDGQNSPNLNDQRLMTYKSKHMEFFPNDQYFASCDRAAATAIRWSGADLSFPSGSTGTQYNYLKSSNKWSYVGDYGDATLKPGDVLITKGNGHIKIYVGPEKVGMRFPGSNSDMYAASYHEYFPMLYKDSPDYDTREYAVFRNVSNN